MISCVSHRRRLGFICSFQTKQSHTQKEFGANEPENFTITMAESGRESISVLNNTAVSLLAEGNLGDAFALLETALRKFHLGLDDEAQLALNCDSAMIHLLVSPAVPLHPTLHRDDVSDCFFPAYNHVFVLGDIAHDEMAVTLLYNYGLALQKRAALEGKASFLSKALQIYSMASAVLQDEGMDDTEFASLVSMALWTNLGCVYSCTSDHKSAKACVDHVKLILARRSNDAHSAFFRHVVCFMDVCDSSPALPPAA